MPARNRGGFTLIELMVALVISGIIATIIFQLLASQSRFARTETAREEVQQNARATLDLITNELRAVGVAGIAMASPDSIRFRMPRAWGVVCKSEPGRIIVAFPPDSESASTAGAEVQLGVPATGLVYTAKDETAADFTGALAECNGTTETGQPDPLLKATSADDSPARIFAAAGLPQLTVAPESPAVEVYLSDEIRYWVDAPSNFPGKWVFRAVASNPLSEVKPFAGPIVEPNGLHFEYLDANGAVIASPNSQLELIRSVRVSVATRSSANVAGSAAETVSTVVYLRNRN